MRKVEYKAFVLTLLFILLTTSSGSSKAWWSEEPAGTTSTHHRITDKAFSLIDGQLRSPAFVNTTAITNNTYGKDNDAIAHGDGTAPNPSRNGGDVQRWYEQYLEYGNPKDLAYCIHLIEDMSVPAHACNIPHAQNPSYITATINTDRFEQSAVSVTSILTPVLSSTPYSKDDAGAAKYYYDKAKSATLDKIENQPWSTYWQAGIEGSDDYQGDGPQGKYTYVNDIFQISSPPQTIVTDQMEAAAQNVAEFLLSVDKKLRMPGVYSVEPSMQTWVTSPQHITGACDKADNIYYRMTSTTNGSEPPDPGVDFQDADTDGTVTLTGVANKLTRFKVQFKAANSDGYNNSGYYLYAINLINDTTKPSIVSYTATSTTRYLGNPAKLIFSVKDSGGSGLKQVELLRKKGMGNYSSVQVKTYPAVSTASGSFDDTPAVAGDYDYNLSVTDNSNNIKTSTPIKVTFNTPRGPAPLPATAAFTIASPNKDTVWYQGHREPVRWKSTSVPKTDRINIEYSPDNGATWVHRYWSYNEGIIYWDISSQNVSKTVKVRVSSYDHPGVTATSETFVIK